MRHLVPPDQIRIFERCLNAGLPYFYTACGTTANLNHLSTDPQETDCSACRTATTEKTPPSPRSPPTEITTPGLSDADVLGGWSDASESLPSEGLPSALPVSPVSTLPTFDPPPTTPPIVPDDAFLLSRLQLAEEADPEGGLGPTDPRRRLLPSERAEIGKILLMLSNVGLREMALPILRLIARLASS